MSTCCFCSNLVSANSTPIWNKPLIETERFVVIPSLGSLVEGWLLIVPKEHFLCVGAFPENQIRELHATKNLVASKLSDRYGQVCVFEHGPHSSERQVGCGVDHAHLHIVPLDFDLRSAAAAFLPPGTNWSPAEPTDCRRAFEQGRDYLYLEQPIGHGYIAANEQFGSQLLRKAIASHLGIANQYNWRDFQHVDKISHTVQVLSTAAAEIS